MQEGGITDDSDYFVADTSLLHTQCLAYAGTHTGAGVHGNEWGIGS